jgi:RimJ/RimL family protein N-acetyltransferase
MVLPAFQGRRLASRSLEMILEMAQKQPRFDRIHAFPSVTNQPSNALCRRFGFELMEETDFLYRGAQLRFNVWELALASWAILDSNQGPLPYQRSALTD